MSKQAVIISACPLTFLTAWSTPETFKTSLDTYLNNALTSFAVDMFNLDFGLLTPCAGCLSFRDTRVL